MLDACPGSAAELQREDFDRQIFQQLRDDTPDLSNHSVSHTFFFLKFHNNCLRRLCLILPPSVSPSLSAAKVSVSGSV